MKDKKNIVVLLLDTARASDVYDDPSLHNLHYFMRNGINYTHAISPGAWTATSHASLFVDDLVSNIKRVSKNFFGTESMDSLFADIKFLNNNQKTLASKLSQHGYYSMLFSNNPFLTSFTNLTLGFNRVYDLWLYTNIKYTEGFAKRFLFLAKKATKNKAKIYKVANAVSRLIPSQLLDRVYINSRKKFYKSIAKFDGSCELDKGASDMNIVLKKYLTEDYNHLPHFMFFNYIEPHEHYPTKPLTSIPDKWLHLSGVSRLSSSDLKKLHDGCKKRLRYLDGAIGKTAEIMKKHGMLDNAVLVITSDHGQFFGEHGMLYHSLFPYEEQAHVPLLALNFENGRLVKTKERIDNTVNITSLHKSILNIASGREAMLNGNLKVPRYVFSEHTGLMDVSDEMLLRMLKNRSTYASRIYATKESYNIPATAIYHGNLKLIHYFGHKQAELYDLNKDTREEENIIKTNRQEAHTMLNSYAVIKGNN